MPHTCSLKVKMDFHDEHSTDRTWYKCQVLALLVKDQHAISVTSLLTYIVYCRTYALADQWEVAA